MFNGKRWNLVDLKRPSDKDTPYIILESLGAEKNSSRTIHTVMINTERNSFSLGRGHDSDLRIKDISVSRKHASLEYKDGKFYFVDLKSKFGTLSLLSDDVELIDQNSQTFQIGRTVVTLKAKLTQPWKNKDRPTETNIAESFLKDPNMKDRFLQRSHSLIGSTSDRKKSKGQNAIPLFETNKQKRRPQENLLGLDGHQQIIEIDGKRYLVIQALDGPHEEVDDRDEIDEEGEDDLNSPY
uniref:FHA domain-containing protein n=1 Tax=Euplotes harpa TaxID=151035 RepID=A0A7S3J5Q0_9SPIT